MPSESKDRAWLGCFMVEPELVGGSHEKTDCLGLGTAFTADEAAPAGANPEVVGSSVGLRLGEPEVGQVSQPGCSQRTGRSGPGTKNSLYSPGHVCHSELVPAHGHHEGAWALGRRVVWVFKSILKFLRSKAQRKHI